MVQSNARGEGPFILTVTELTGRVKALLEESFPFVWVEGELSNVSRHSTGHYFFTLKDERSQIRAVMFRYQAQLLPFKPENGIHVIIRGRVSVYEMRGEYQILAEFMEPLRKGSLQIAFEQTKKKLEAEGLFHPSRKRALPLLPQKIVVITSPTGAAIRDILRIMEQRFANLEILVVPVRVQGLVAPAEIIAALEMVGSIASVDVVILGRGGGSMEDLWAFNDEGVARAIAGCQVPVVSAVGHEIDFTIADFVADVRASTPSAAAELVVEKKERLVGLLDALRTRLEKGFRYPFAAWKNELTGRTKGLSDPRKRLADLNLRTDEVSQRLIHLSGYLIQRKKDGWGYCHNRVQFLSPRNQVNSGTQELHQRESLLRSRTAWGIERRAAALEKLMAQLDGASPLTILRRGYSITSTWPKKDIVRDTSALAPQQVLHIKLYRGEIFCRVEKAKDGHDTFSV